MLTAITVILLWWGVVQDIVDDKIGNTCIYPNENLMHSPL